MLIRVGVVQTEENMLLGPPNKSAIIERNRRLCVGNERAQGTQYTPAPPPICGDTGPLSCNPQHAENANGINHSQSK